MRTVPLGRGSGMSGNEDRLFAKPNQQNNSSELPHQPLEGTAMRCKEFVSRACMYNNHYLHHLSFVAPIALGLVGAVADINEIN